MFANLFYHIAEKIKERNGYNLYAHNFGRFDSVFIIKSLADDGYGYDLKANWKEKDLIYIILKDKHRKLKNLYWLVLAFAPCCLCSLEE